MRAAWKPCWSCSAITATTSSADSLGGFLALVALLLAAAVIVVLGRFSALEADVARQSAERALEALNDRTAALSATPSDRSQWDDAAAFVAGRDAGSAFFSPTW